MPSQPLELYQVEETGELVLKHKDLNEALVSDNVIMIVNHNDKIIVLWIGKRANTRAKFAGARSSRRFLTERSLSYRVKTFDEGEEPKWFQNFFKIKVAKRSRDEPTSLEALAILNEMKAEGVPSGYQLEACIISRDFYVPVEYKSSIMGKDTSTTKFDKSSYLPEGFFLLPSETYRPRLLVRNGKILATDFLVSIDINKKDQLIDSLQQEVKEKKSEIKSLQQDIKKKEQEIETLRQDSVKKNHQIENLQQESVKKEQYIETLRQDISKKTERIKTLQQDISEKAQQIKTSQQNTKEKTQQIKNLQQDISKKDQEIKEFMSLLSKKQLKKLTKMRE